MLDLNEVRGRIDQIDNSLVELFRKRMEVCREVAEFKIGTGKKVLDRQREIQKLETLGGLAQNDFEKHGITEMFTQIMAMSRKLQYQMMAEHGIVEKLPFGAVDDVKKEQVKVVFQGVEGAYSHAAMLQYFGDCTESFHVPNFEAAMKAVADGEADYAVLPIENSSAGQVGDVYDLLIKYDNTIIGETYLSVNHCLLGLPGADISQIKTVYSHPQGLMQCVGYLNSHADWQQISQPNTAMSAQKVVEEKDRTKAAIASRLAAKLYGLEILAEDVNDNQSNTTRFIIVTREKQYPRDARKVSICFEIAHESGSLYNTLSHIIYNNLNMTKIESRPIADRPFEYRFFVDFEGNLGDAAVENALFGIQEEVKNLKILGNY
ncbi:MAG: prephenate dehydratase [Lachnospiraceae bacterium]|nr:prephenate dehydratase [Lachnospiraceae bacterium]